MVAFVPVQMVKAGHAAEVADTPAQYAQYLWDGWVPGVVAPPVLHPLDDDVVELIDDATSETAKRLRAAFDAWGEDFAGDLRAFNIHMPENYGAVGNGTTNDQAAFDAATAAIRTAGGGKLVIPPRMYLIDQLRMVRRMSVIGSGWQSRLRQDVFAGHLVVLDDEDVEWTHLSNLMIDGHREVQVTPNDGINYNNETGSLTFGDPVHRLDNLLIYTPKGNGLTLTATCRETRATNIFITGADLNGYNLNATDCFFLSCTAAASGEHGFYALGNNSKFTNCKAFASGRLVAASDGFFVMNGGQGFTNCEAQDNGRTGFTLYHSGDSMLTACIADTNGRETWGMGFQLDDADGAQLHACLAYNRDGLTTQKFGLLLTNSDNVQVSMKAHNNAEGNWTGTSLNSHIVINGQQIITAASGAAYTLTVGNDGVLTTMAV